MNFRNDCYFCWSFICHHKSKSKLRLFFLLSFLYLINLIFVIIMINSKSYSDSKFSWILFILILPIFGHIFYLIFGLKSKSNRFQYLESIDKYEVNSYLDKATLNVKKTSDI